MHKSRITLHLAAHRTLTGLISDSVHDTETRRASHTQFIGLGFTSYNPIDSTLKSQVGNSRKRSCLFVYARIMSTYKMTSVAHDLITNCMHLVAAQFYSSIAFLSQ